MKNATWLQGLGACAGKPAGLLVPGDVLGWNYGSTSIVKSIVSSTQKTITIEEEFDGKLYTRKLLKDRVVALVRDGKFTVLNCTQSEWKLCRNLFEWRESKE
jgi:hypothetical protein